MSSTHYNPTDDGIDHVVVLMLENHSFDELLGCYGPILGLDGVDPRNLRENVDTINRITYTQMESSARRVMVDPKHYFLDVMQQIYGVRKAPRQVGGDNSGFMTNFVWTFPKSTTEERQAVMNYRPHGFLPALHGLADDFTICDRWFGPVPSGTWPARFMGMSGTSRGLVGMPMDGQHKLDLKGYFAQKQPTIADRLLAKGVSCKFYHHDFPMSWVMDSMRKPEVAGLFYEFEQFRADASGPASQFPAFSFIEPRYQGCERSDDHPPQDVMVAQKLIADVYNSLAANQELFESTMLVIVYDEHGGFYDHVVPPAATAPDGYAREYNFRQYGPRVPAVVVSPRVGRGFSSIEMDHTSYLKYVIDKFGLSPLGNRTATANSIGQLIVPGRPRTDMVSQIVLTPDQLTPSAPEWQKSQDKVVDELHRSTLPLLTRLLSPLENDAPNRWARLARSIDFHRTANRHPRSYSDEEILEHHRRVEELVPQYAERARQIVAHAS